MKFDPCVLYNQKNTIIQVEGESIRKIIITSI
jgi:hypothetical protein